MSDESDTIYTAMVPCPKCRRNSVLWTSRQTGRSGYSFALICKKCLLDYTQKRRDTEALANPQIKERGARHDAPHIPMSWRRDV